MSSDKRLTLFLQRALLALPLLTSVAFSACGDSDTSSAIDPSEGDDDDADDDADDDDTVDPPEGDDDDGDDVVDPPEGDDDDEPARPAPSKPDGGGTTTPKPDAGGTTTPKPDAGGTTTPKPDAGTDEPEDDAGTPPTTGGGGMMRGDDPTEMSAGAAGKYMVKTYTSGYRDGPAYADSTIHYPEGAEPPFAIVAVVPGFVSPQSSIRPWGPFLASHGIVTMTIGTNSGSDQPPARASALLDAIKTLEEENTRSGSPLMGKLDLTRKAVMGWSMGGGGALLAVERDQKMKAVISLCGWNPGNRYSKVMSPALMFAATSDPLAGGQSQGFYGSIPNETPKMLYEVQGGSHQYANNPSGHSRSVGRYGLSWMKTYLEEDPRYKKFLTADKPGGLASFMSNVK